MSFSMRQPFWVPKSQPGAWTFSALYFLESVTRASVATVIPLQAYQLFGSKEAVSLVYTAVAMAALCFSFAIPFLIMRLSRRWTYTLGAVMSALCAAMLTLGFEVTQVLTMFLRTTGAAVLNVTLALYIMDNIHKQQLVRSEPLRFAVATLAWGTFPFIGIWLFETYGIWAPALLSVGAAVSLLTLFWVLRLIEKGPIRAGAMKPPNPLRFFGRFASQPRLRLAWLIAFGRSSFWVTFFIYGPILMVEGGYGPQAGGLVVALGNLMLFVNMFVGRVAKRFSIRLVLAGSLFLSAALVILVGLLGAEHALLAGTAFVAAALFASVLDGLGPVPFLRAVHSHERPQMTTVYRTYLDASELIPPLIYFFMFQWFGFSGAFWALAIGMSGIGWLVWRYLPTRL